mmetsp:Transcript_26853/g.87876  ORF Transcript_26853/g.87876 Transcript_26853/m.87876 type:complete len:220 (-) Transcript_26853:373-1032(-)
MLLSRLVVDNSSNHVKISPRRRGRKKAHLTRDGAREGPVSLSATHVRHRWASAGIMSSSIPARSQIHLPEDVRNSRSSTWILDGCCCWLHCPVSCSWSFKRIFLLGVILRSDPKSTRAIILFLFVFLLLSPSRRVFTSHAWNIVCIKIRRSPQRIHPLLLAFRGRSASFSRLLFLLSLVLVLLRLAYVRRCSQDSFSSCLCSFRRRYAVVAHIVASSPS